MVLVMLWSARGSRNWASLSGGGVCVCVCVCVCISVCSTLTYCFHSTEVGSAVSLRHVHFLQIRASSLVYISDVLDQL